MTDLTSITNNTLDYYNHNAIAFAEGTVAVRFTEMQDAFLKYIPKGGKLLDYGCGSGRDTKYFLDRGYDVDAIDGSEALCKIASSYTGITVQNMLFEELEAADKYDGIWACASILHIAKSKLPDILQQMAKATKDNGVLYASFKYGDWEGERDGRYFTYLTEDSFLELLATVSELKVERIWVTNDVRAERGEERWLNIILRKQQAD